MELSFDKTRCIVLGRIAFYESSESQSGLVCLSQKQWLPLIQRITLVWISPPQRERSIIGDVAIEDRESTKPERFQILITHRSHVPVCVLGKAHYVKSRSQKSIFDYVPRFR